MKGILKITLILVLVMSVLGACATMQSSGEGDQGPTKMRKSPCASLWDVRHV